jgi:hypothetical protein
MWPYNQDAELRSDGVLTVKIKWTPPLGETFCRVHNDRSTAGCSFLRVISGQIFRGKLRCTYQALGSINSFDPPSVSKVLPSMFVELLDPPLQIGEFPVAIAVLIEAQGPFSSGSRY